MTTSVIADLYSTRHARLAHCPALPDVGGVLDRAGVREGQPFVLGANGSYDVHLNRFLRELPSWGVRADNSVMAYARDVTLFVRFLETSRRGKRIWDCDGEDLRAYKRVRLWTDGPQAVSVGTWNRSVAALDKWVAWSLDAGLLPRAPFRYVDKTVMTPAGPRRVHVNAEMESDPQDEPLRFVAFEDYLLWRNVGLRGELPEGRSDSRWRGRHGERNGLFADVLVHSGMRLGEGASLLVPEVPPLSGPGEIRVAGAVAKRGRGRRVYLPPRKVRQVHHFLAVERDAIVVQCAAAGGFPGWSDARQVARAGRYALLAQGAQRSWPYARISPTERRRLAWDDSGVVSGEPLWLWLADDGRPLQSAAWQAAFRRANERCTSFGLGIEVHPHTLRHTYAVYMLGLLLRQAVRALGQPLKGPLARSELRRLLVGNPMRTLQLLLGHAREATVYVYLDVLDEAQEIVLGALAQWDAQSVVLERMGTAG
ncbi:tyrosine-type recombinase/integrase [Streptomyces sp. NPDC087844]|uniref:tyrosine-type recombinase/integrase n=1 Tax=Streptomyces sp. NPDC087844 TaxID=3365805 RepID=UPI00381DD4F4